MAAFVNVTVKIDPEQIDEDEFVRQMLMKEIHSPPPPSPPLPQPLMRTEFAHDDDELSKNNLARRNADNGHQNGHLRDVDRLADLRSKYKEDLDSYNLQSWLAYKFLLSFEFFTPCAQKLWTQVYYKSKLLPEDVLKAWYKRVEGAVGIHSNLLDSALAVVERDNSRNADVKPRQMNESEMAAPRNASQQFLLIRETEANKLGLSLTTTASVMESQTSSLQLFLLPKFDKSDEQFKKRKRMGLDQEKQDFPDDLIYWIPTSSEIPFQVFQKIAKSRVTKRTEFRLNTQALKVRYVEFMTKAFIKDRSRLQLLAAVFTAFGPNLFTYPIRVIELLQRRSVLRTDLDLPIFDSTSESKTFPPLDHPFVATTVRSKESRKSHNTISSEALSRVRSLITDLPKSASRTNTRTSADSREAPAPSRSPPRTGVKKKSANLTPLGSRRGAEDGEAASSSLQKSWKYTAWQETSEQGLNSYGLKALSQVGFQEAYKRHLLNSKEPMNNDFTLGVLTGICISIKSQEEQQMMQKTLQAKVLPEAPSAPRLRLSPSEAEPTVTAGIQPKPPVHVPPPARVSPPIQENQYSGDPRLYKLRPEICPTTAGIQPKPPVHVPPPTHVSPPVQENQYSGDPRLYKLRPEICPVTAGIQRKPPVHVPPPARVSPPVQENPYSGDPRLYRPRPEIRPMMPTPTPPTHLVSSQRPPNRSHSDSDQNQESLPLLQYPATRAPDFNGYPGLRSMPPLPPGLFPLNKISPSPTPPPQIPPFATMAWRHDHVNPQTTALNTLPLPQTPTPPTGSSQAGSQPNADSQYGMFLSSKKRPIPPPPVIPSPAHHSELLGNGDSKQEPGCDEFDSRLAKKRIVSSSVGSSSGEFSLVFDYGHGE